VRDTSAPGAQRDDRNPCPSGADLLCASTNELPPEEQQAVVQHVTHCKVCQAELGEIEKWLRVMAAQEAEAKKSNDARRTPLTSRRRGTSVVGWLSIASAVLVVVVLTAMFQQRTEVARADEILARLAQRERGALVIQGPYLWGADFSSLARRDGHSGPGVGVGGTRLDAASAPSAADTLLRENGFDARHPFRIAPIQKWSAALANRRDRVTSRDGLLIVTISGRGALREIEIAIDEKQFAIVRQHWVFRDVGRIDCRRPTPDAPALPGTNGAPRPGGSR
jgi:hypothetical protein